MTWEQFKEMSLKAKLLWLIHYYGIMAVVAVIAIAVLVNLVKTVLFPEPGPDGHVIILGDEITSPEAMTFEEELSELTGKSISVEQFYKSDVYGQAAFAAKMGVDQVEIVIAPFEEMEQLQENEAVDMPRKIDRGDLYLAVTTRARQGEVLDTMVDYFEKQF